MFLKVFAFCKTTTNNHKVYGENVVGQKCMQLCEQSTNKNNNGILRNKLDRPGKQHMLSRGCLREYHNCTKTTEKKLWEMGGTESMKV